LGDAIGIGESKTLPGPTQRFDFLDRASTSAVVAMLLREHAQTIAVVLAHLAPQRAADILAALPEKLQADTVERLSVLGETDAESVTVIERELSLWLATRAEDRGTIARRRESVTKILAASDAKTRRSIVSKLRIKGSEIDDMIPAAERNDKGRQIDLDRPMRQSNSRRTAEIEFATIKRRFPVAGGVKPSLPLPTQAAPQPRFEFDQLVDFDTMSLSAVLREVDANVLALALVGSREELVDRITLQMPKRTARVFRRELRRLGPTKLSDVTDAQQIVADAAARYLRQRRQPLAAIGR
jgi:flagellar motor switch protein FliG